MSVTITIPDEVAQVLGNDIGEREQRARESIALELYREGKISLRMMGILANSGDDYWAADALRVRHGIPLVVGNIEDENAETVARILEK